MKKLLVVAAAACAALNVCAERTVVDVPAGEAGAIKTALADADPGTTLRLSAGWYEYAGSLVLDKDVWIVSSAGPEETKIFSTDGGKSDSQRPVVVSHPDAVLSGVDVSAYAESGTFKSCLGVTMTAGMITNCFICNHRGTQWDTAATANGIAVNMSGGLLVDCLVTNTLSEVNNINAVGIYAKGANTVILRCRILGNGNYINGAYSKANAFAGGAYLSNATIVNSLVAGNYAAYGAGLQCSGDSCQIINCTLVKNCAKLASTDDKYGIYYNYCKARPQDSLCWKNASGGVERTDPDPGFVDGEHDDFHLAASSSAIDDSTGTEETLGEFDLDLKGRFNAVRSEIPKADKGCYEFYESEEISVAILDPVQIGANLYAPVTNEFTVQVSPRSTVYDEADCWWTFDGTEPTADNHDAVGTVVTNVSLAGGSYTARCAVMIAGETYSDEKPFAVLSDKVFLVETNPNAKPPYATWETAATTLADVLPYFKTGATLTIGDGTYQLPSAIAIPEGATIRSANGPAKTTIRGIGANLTAFNLSNANSMIAGIRFYGLTMSGYPAGIALTSGVVTNCIFDTLSNGGNTGAAIYASGGTVSDCVFTNCTTGAQNVGAVVDLLGPTSMDRCRIYGSRCSSTGTGSLQGAVRLIKNANKSPTLRNTLVVDSRLRGCSGIYVASGWVENCTVASNETLTATATSCAVYAVDAAAHVTNTIAALNVDSNGAAANAGGNEGSFGHCAVPGGYGADTVEDDPLFKNPAKWNFHLRQSSPCVNAGALLAWMEGATDLDGNPRLGRKSDRVPDIGCYEGVFNGLTLFVR